MEKDIKYLFKVIDKCNMCGNDDKDNRTLGRRLNRSQGFNPRKKTGISVSVKKCSKCGLIYPNPMPVPNSLEDHYGVPPEQYWSKDYLTISPDYYQGELRILESIKPLNEIQKALDIGAGVGKCMIALTNKGIDCYGIEPSKPFYDRAISKMNIDPKKIKNVSIEDCDFEEGSFDYVTFGAVLEHLYDPYNSLEKALKWLKKGGVLSMEVPNSDWTVAKILNSVYRLQGLDYVANISPMHEPFHIYEFTKKSFETIESKLNVEIVFFENWLGDPLLPGPMGSLVKRYMKLKKTGMQISVWFRKK